MSPTLHIPLAFRLPNPPAHFFGRERELAWFEEVWREARTIAIWGAGGIGKSTLLRKALHEHAHDLTERVVYVGLAGAPGVEVALLDVVFRTLCMTLGYEPARADRTPRDADALLANIIDIADEHQLCVVLDDVHASPRAELVELLDAATRYAHRSRWLTTSREQPSGLTLDAELHLGPMARAPLHQLAMHLSPHEDPRGAHRVTQAVAGSPWRLIQAMSKGLDHSKLRLAGFTHETQDALRRLAALRMPQTDDTLGACGVEPGVLDELLRESLVTRTLEGVRLHDMARESLSLSASDWAPQVGGLLEGLAGRAEPNAQLERVRVAVDAGHDALAVDELERVGEALFARGFAPELWSILHPHDRPDLLRWRVKCAHVHGTAQAFDAIAHAEAPHDQLDLRALDLHLAYRQERYQEGVALALALIEDAEQASDVAVAMDARQVLAILYLYTGRPVLAEEVLDRTEPTDELQRGMAQVLKALLAAQRGDGELAAAIADRLRDSIGGMVWPMRAKVAYNVCLIDYRLQRFGAALDLFNAELETDTLAFTMFAGRKSLAMGAALALQAADVASARGVLARIASTPGAASTQNRRELLIHGVDLVDSGATDLDMLRARATDAMGRSAWDDASFGVALLARESLFTGEPVRPMEIPADAPPSSNLTIAALFAEQSALRRGEDAPETAIPEPLRAYRKLAIMWDMTAAMRGGRDHDMLWRARERAHEERLHLIELEITAAGCLWESVDTRGGERRWRDALEALRENVSTRRFDALARFWRAVRVRDVAEIVRLARGPAELGARVEAVRYAQALTSTGDPALDPLERSALMGARRELGWAKVRVVGEPSAESWVVDTASKTVAAPHGEILLERHATPWKLLEILLNETHATKERLVTQIWEADEYHPLRHDNRLRLTARNLRRLVELEPKEHEWILTDEDGYRLGASTVVLQ